MPLVSIDVLRGRSPSELEALGDAVQRAMVETLGVPEHDRFSVLTEHDPATLRFDRHYLEGDRGPGFVLVRVTLSAGRTTEAKAAFYARTTELLAEAAGVRPQDVAIVLTENQREDWSFGGGDASYVVTPPESWR